MKKYFVFSDVHSFYDELMTALKEAGFDYNDPDHIIISCGDLCDRGRQPKEALTFINSLPEDRKICIIGNHERIMEDVIARGFCDATDVYNGTSVTADLLCEEGQSISDLKDNPLWNEYKKSWRLFYETDDYIFVHGWIPFKHDFHWPFRETFEYDPKWREASLRQFEEASWENGMEAWSKGIREEGKTIVCGHWHTSWGHAYLHNEGVEYPEEDKPEQDAKFTPFIDEGIIALDGCTAYSHLVNIYVIEMSETK